MASPDYQQNNTYLLSRNMKNKAEAQYKYACAKEVKKLFRFAHFPP